LIAPKDRYTPILQGFPLGIAGALILTVAVAARYYHLDLISAHPALLEILDDVRAPIALLTLCVVSVMAGLLSLTGSLFAVLERTPRALFLLRKGNAAVLAWFVFYCWIVLSITGQVVKLDLLIEGGTWDAIDLFKVRRSYIWLPALGATFVAWLHLRAWRRHVISIYIGEGIDEPARGDLIVENWRSHGRDPRYRKSNWTSSWAHLLVIVIVPWLIGLLGCVKPYRVPWGGGKPAVQKVMMVKPKKKKKKKDYILSMDTAIIFNVPELDDSKIYEEVEMSTRLTYMADASAAHGKLGNKVADQAGFWDGFKDGEMRFIRIKHGGPDWDDGMDGVSRADMNFLAKFRELSGGMPTALAGEAHKMSLLKKYPKGQAPPFVYMTGAGSISYSGRDLKIMRDYLRGGSMLFADCGSPSFHSNFRSFISRLFPGKQLTNIADDDPIFQLPFTFPNGAPPLWHHGGYRALGIKEGGRWLVFYHPGDVNDAWKTGHSGMDPSLADGAFQIGINAVYYSTMRYMQKSRKYRVGK
jgi:hypothetical protein